ncbi:acetyl-CoA carboxylase biotin carboxylase subunit family protein [Streptomyces sp. NBC_00102]|uniref:ATP-grasp domain-containing protein n=1 Tax=Streptomyces sp. NBC_00102 TaxID=2975652 RepID=UPI0022532251|nr:ATP-grasp domain-containing protein [Streptomyces sp. NBC_00102]MCX5398291.1 ATP-grasp domain-containing protein [Streptomyces sp. NBC_00102]
MTRPFRVAWIGGRPAPVAGAKELGIDVVLVHEEGLYEPSVAEHCERIVHAPITDGPAVLAVLRPLHEERPFDRVLTTSEPAGICAGYVTDALGLPGVGATTARTLKDKALTRAALDRHGLSPVRHRVVRSAEEAEEFQRSLGAPLVLKPVDGAASRHIHRAEDAVETAKAFREMTAAGFSEALAEEYLDGPVISVESFSHAGRHLPIGYSEYQVNERYVEWAVSTPSRLAQPWLPELRSLTARLLDAVGLTEGPSHSEFVLTPQGPRVLESHARLGGHAIPELVRRAFGPDLARMMLTVPLGIEELPAEPPEPVGGAAIRFFRPDPGVVASVTVAEDNPAVVRRLAPGELDGVYLPLLAELRDLETGAVVARNPGDVVPVLNTLADCSSGYALSSGADAAEAEARCLETDQKIRIAVG